MIKKIHEKLNKFPRKKEGKAGSSVPRLAESGYEQQSSGRNKKLGEGAVLWIRIKIASVFRTFVNPESGSIQVNLG